MNDSPTPCLKLLRCSAVFPSDRFSGLRRVVRSAPSGSGGGCLSQPTSCGRTSRDLPNPRIIRQARSR